MRAVVVAAVLLLGAGCSKAVDVEAVPIGTPVEVTRQDGGVVTGTLTGRDDKTLKVSAGRTTRQIPRDQVADLALTNAPKPAALPSVAKFREYTVPEGTTLRVRLDSSLGSDTSRVGEDVEAVLTEAVMVDGVEVLPEGSVLKGTVSTATPSGNVKGRASLGAQVRSVTLPSGGATYSLSAGMRHTAEATKGSDAKKIGIPAVGGAIIGALLGGKKGALIGTTVGGGAGAIVVLTTSGPEVRYARGTALSLRIEDPIDVRVPIRR